MTARAALAVWIEGQRVGTLGTASGRFVFRYHASWLRGTWSYPLSPHLPLRVTPFEDDAGDRRVQWLFENLLPEGRIREALARHARIQASDTFGLLARLGRESAGALVLLSEDELPDPSQPYQPLAREALRRLIADLPRVPLLAAGGRARVSLSGTRHKLALHRQGGGFLLPVHGASSLVIKPDDAPRDRFPFSPANEHFCLALARRIGIAAPPTELLHLPQPVLLLERFDRTVDDAGQVSRLHQLDLCQLLNRPASDRSEGQGGITFEEAFRALDHTRQPAVSRNQLLRWRVFNYLIGNSAAHAKDIAFLLSASGTTLAPAYDLLCVRAHGEDFGQMAMTIGGQVRHGRVAAEHWDRLARQVSIAPAFLRRLRRELAQTVPATARLLLDEDPSFSDEERAFLATVLLVIDRHAGYLRRTI
jgi:serine/threonine-protein kinase HipA